MFEKKAMDGTARPDRRREGQGGEGLTGGKRSDRVRQGLLLRADGPGGPLADAKILTDEPLSSRARAVSDIAFATNLVIRIPEMRLTFG